MSKLVQESLGTLGLFAGENPVGAFAVRESARLSNEYKSSRKRSKAPQFPQYLQIETVSVCNARCTMCLTSDCKRDEAFMSDELFTKIADELAEHAEGIQRVTVQAAGEPLLDKKLEPRIRLLKDKKLRFVAFATNGALMDEERAVSVLDSGVDEVSFSVDGATRHTYEKIRVGLNFDRVIANIERFLQLRDAGGADVAVRIRMTAQKANETELDQFATFWRQRLGRDDSVYAKVIHTWGNSQKLEELPDGYDYDRLNAGPCGSPWSSLVVFSDGRVPMCCCDYNASLCLGNAKSQSIMEMWRGKTINKVRLAHSVRGRKAMKMCANCTVWDDQAKLLSDS